MLRKKRYLFPLVFCLSIGACFFSFDLAESNVYGQSSGQSTAPKAAAIASLPPAAEKTGPAKIPAALTEAAAENIRLKDDMTWTFGGKPQRGWDLYVLLIQQTIGTETAAETPEFAEAVAAWQSDQNLTPTGVIDEVTLGRLIKGWQERRLNSSRYPSAEQLVTASVSNFYDPARPADLLKVEAETFAAYKKMAAAAAFDLRLKTDRQGDLAPEVQFLKIISAFRSREYQAGLRAASPNSGRAGLAVNSPHFTGSALDIYVGGEPVSTADANRAFQVKTPAYRWLVKNAARFGFYPYFYEPWHWEYVNR